MPPSTWREGAGHVGRMADRIAAKIRATCDGVARVETPAETVAICNELAELLGQYEQLENLAAEAAATNGNDEMTTHWTIENVNYANDPRVRAAGQAPERRILTDLVEYAETDAEAAELDRLAAQARYLYQVCPTCDGHGAHVNPSIDAGGLELDGWSDDELEDYRAGAFDVVCYGCNGKRVIEVLDERRSPPELVRRIADWRRFEAECHAEHLAELRAGC